MLVPLIFLFLATAHGSILHRIIYPEQRLNVRIVGGDDAPEGLAPYQVSLQVSIRNEIWDYCSGAILNDRWVLTAGRCVAPSPALTEARKNAPSSILAGTHQLIEGGVRYATEKIVRHPKYHYHLLKNDIALIKVAKKIEFTDKVQPIALPTKDTEARANLMVTGWGFTEYGLPVLLQMLNQTAVDQEECKRRVAEADYPPLLPMHLCAFKDVSHGICAGDLGGPLVEGNSLVGLVSFTDLCGYGHPDIYSRVFYHLDWILETMKAN